MMRAEHSAHIN